MVYPVGEQSWQQVVLSLGFGPKFFRLKVETYLIFVGPLPSVEVGENTEYKKESCVLWVRHGLFRCATGRRQKMVHGASLWRTISHSPESDDAKNPGRKKKGGELMSYTTFWRRSLSMTKMSDMAQVYFR